jgi:hypothetical protein
MVDRSILESSEPRESLPKVAGLVFDGGFELEKQKQKNGTSEGLSDPANVPSSAPTHVAVPTDLFNALTQYLATKPFNEVAGFLGGLNEQAKPVTLSSVPDN